MPNTLAEDIQLFLSLHHRADELSAEERVTYDDLRVRVAAALVQPVPTPPAPVRPPVSES